MRCRWSLEMQVCIKTLSRGRGETPNRPALPGDGGVGIRCRPETAGGDMGGYQPFTVCRSMSSEAGMLHFEPLEIPSVCCISK